MSSLTDRKLSLYRPSVSSVGSTLEQTPADRRTSSSASSQASPRLSPKVQVIPHTQTISYDNPLPDVERKLLSNARSDNLDMSTKDFDFEDVFTYDKPQKKLARVVEVSTSARERDWSGFSFSHYTPALSARQKVNSRPKTSISEMYLKTSCIRRK